MKSSNTLNTYKGLIYVGFMSKEKSADSPDFHSIHSTYRPVHLGVITRAFFQAISNCMTSHDKSSLVFPFGFPSESHIFF